METFQIKQVILNKLANFFFVFFDKIHQFAAIPPLGRQCWLSPLVLLPPHEEGWGRISYDSYFDLVWFNPNIPISFCVFFRWLYNISYYDIPYNISSCDISSKLVWFNRYIQIYIFRWFSSNSGTQTQTWKVKYWFPEMLKR